MTNIEWNELSSLEQLEELDERSKESPVVIFKHSTRCSISAASLNRLERKWDEKVALGSQAFFLDLIANRDISNEVASRYGVTHQSPQVLVIKNGECIYNNSHFGITFESVSEYLKPISA